MMRILFLCHRIPYPPNKGDKLRAFHQLRGIAARHEVDLFTLADDPRDLAHGPALRPYCSQVTVHRLVPAGSRLRALRSLLTETPFTPPYFYSRALEQDVRRAVTARSYDRVFAYCSSVAQYAELARGVPLVMDFVDMDSDKWSQYAGHSRFPFSTLYRREGRLLRDYERKIAETAARSLVTTEREARVLRAICPAARIAVVQNGVDTDYFAPRDDGPPAGGPAVIFTGEMDYFPNVDAVTFFAQQVLPRIRRAIPEVRFLIVGKRPVRAVRNLRRLPGIEVTGFVPDVRPYFGRASVAVVPLAIAAGVQNKILEAMAMGLPVVAMPRPVQGLSPALAELVEVGESAAELAEKTIRLLQDPAAARRRGAECRRTVMEENNWDVNMRGMLRLIEDLKQEAAPAGDASSCFASPASPEAL